jgi:hypothetical protein
MGPAAPDGAPPSLGELTTGLVEDVRRWFDAEFALYRIEATRRSISVGVAAGMIFGALALAQAALVALLVGIVILLSPMVGTGLAIVIVIGTTLAIIALLGWLGKRRIEAIIDPDGKA